MTFGGVTWPHVLYAFLELHLFRSFFVALWSWAVYMPGMLEMGGHHWAFQHGRESAAPIRKRPQSFQPGDYLPGTIQQLGVSWKLVLQVYFLI